MWWQNIKGERGYHSKRKKAFLTRVDRLHTQKTLIKAWFRIDYLPGIFTESITYTKNDLKIAERDAHTFTAAHEIRYIRKYNGAEQ